MVEQFIYFLVGIKAFERSASKCVRKSKFGTCAITGYCSFKDLLPVTYGLLNKVFQEIISQSIVLCFFIHNFSSKHDHKNTASTSKFACVQTSPISFVARGKGTSA